MKLETREVAISCPRCIDVIDGCSSYHHHLPKEKDADLTIFIHYDRIVVKRGNEVLSECIGTSSPFWYQTAIEIYETYIDKLDVVEINDRYTGCRIRSENKVPSEIILKLLSNALVLKKYNVRR